MPLFLKPRFAALAMVPALLLAGGGLGPARAQSAPAMPVDYGAAASWVCRAGEETPCVTGLDAMLVTSDGQRSLETFAPAAAPPAIDCFYVYPTISREPTPYADMTAGPEVVEVTRAQAGRLTSRCRLFAPLYRQITMTGLTRDMAKGAHLDMRGPYADILAAWRWYIAHENHGRGVVLVGHSQGAILLQRLIAEEIDGKPVQERLISAFLAGDPSLPVPRGAVVGGLFKHVPLCAAAAETGCVYAWGSYLADDPATNRNFGRNPGGALVAACVNPAAPSGGPGELDAYLPKPSIAPVGDPPWVRIQGQLSAQCVADEGGNVLRVSVLPSPFSELLKVGLGKYLVRPGWGLHRLDLSLPQGNILAVVAAESEAWKGR
jgi:hypothetical protein